MTLNNQLKKDKRNYKDFVDKFKPKHTTDDCFTPDLVYDVVKNYVIDKFNIDKSSIVRPFWPGGDYEHEDYDGKVVVDNPPFSIITKIKNFYIENNVKFFLFCNSMTSINLIRKHFGKSTLIPISENIVYQNGAVVPTSFITNLFNDDTIVYFDPNFKNKLKDAVEQTNNKAVHRLPRYKYPENVVRVTDIVKAGRSTSEPIVIKSKQSKVIKELDNQKKSKKKIFGSGLLVDDETAEQLEHLKNLPPIDKKGPGNIITWKLSDRERQIIDKLNQN